MCVCVVLTGDSQPHGEGHGDLRGGAGSHRHHAESGLAHQRHEEETRARRQVAGTTSAKIRKIPWICDSLCADLS